MQEQRVQSVPVPWKFPHAKFSRPAVRIEIRGEVSETLTSIHVDFYHP